MVLLPLGLVVGLLAGLTGLGGAIIALPVMLWLGWNLAEAVPIVLSGTLVAALCSLLVLWRRVYVRYRLALVMAAASIPGVVFGHWLIQRTPATVAELALCLLVAALALLGFVRAPASGSARRQVLLSLNPQTGRLAWSAPTAMAASGIGVASGFTAGLFGLGGSFLIAPFLRAVSEFDAHSVLATTLMTVALISGGALTSIVLTTDGLSGVSILPYALGAAVGTTAGSRAAIALPGATINTLLSTLLLVLALVMAVRLLGGG